VAGARSAQLASSGPGALLLYGHSGVFLTKLEEDGTLAPFEPVSSAVEAWPVDVDNDGREDLALQFGEDSIGIALTSHRGKPGTVSSWLSGRWLASGDSTEIIVLRSCSAARTDPCCSPGTTGAISRGLRTPAS
jgi:hypothetical protein